MKTPNLLATIALVSVCSVPGALGQSYPSRPVRIINPFPAGGGLDYLIRPIAQKMSENLKHAVIVDNRPGANGQIGSDLTAKAPPDGYTLLAGTTGALPMNAVVQVNLPYDPVRDFAPVSNFAESAFLLTVHPSVPARSVKEFIVLAKARPGEITYASFGTASSPHFGGELFNMMAGVKLLHVPYKGSAPSLGALMAGHVMSSFDSMQSIMPQVRAGRLRALGLAAAKRSPAAPEVPTISESGLPGFEVGSWYGLLAPAKTPREIVARLHAEIVKTLGVPEIRDRITSVGTEPLGNSPEEFAAQIRNDLVKWGKVARAANIRAE
ncbi:MAG TPA: tripartite tricarboxylate transporter substrate binding protein [Burkholderiales bacterium]|nr:tripartite tricarboxylate transporter substrate binding protein [Burkholderiales bacterium]